MADEIAIRKLMEACDQDPKLQARLFQEPAAVAKEHGVELADNEVQQLKRVGALQGLINEFKSVRVGGPGPIRYPIGYPIDRWWKQIIYNHVVSYRTLYNPIFNPIFYPIGYVFNAGRPFGGEASARAEASALRLRKR
jgi:hypothetical protein